MTRLLLTNTTHLLTDLYLAIETHQYRLFWRAVYSAIDAAFSRTMSTDRLSGCASWENMQIFLAGVVLPDSLTNTKISQIIWMQESPLTAFVV